MPATIDTVIHNYLSRKLMVFIIGCSFAYLGKISGAEWVQIATIYIGGQACVDMVKAWRS